MSTWIQAFRQATLCRWVSDFRRFERTCFILQGPCICVGLVASWRRCISLQTAAIRPTTQRRHIPQAPTLGNTAV